MGTPPFDLEKIKIPAVFEDIIIERLVQLERNFVGAEQLKSVLTTGRRF